MKTLFLLLAFASLVAAIEPGMAATHRGHPLDFSKLKREAETAVKNNLKDPYSAHFQDEHFSRGDGGGIAFCGKVNAKNGYGGYVGFRRFIVSVVDGHIAHTLIEEPVDSEHPMDVVAEIWTAACAHKLETGG